MIFRPGKKSGVDARERSLWAGLLSMGMVFPIAVVLGYFIGQWVGGKFGHPEAGRIIGLVLGIITGFWELFKVAKRLDKYGEATQSDIGPNSGADDATKGGGEGA